MDHFEYFKVFLTFAILFTFSATALDDKSLAVIVICQNNPVSKIKCLEKELNLIDQGLQNYQIIRSHRDFIHDGDWTIFPIVRWLSKERSDIPTWVLFVTELTNVNILNLQNLIGHLDSKKNGFVGFALTDPEPTIIHHFSSNVNFQFPLIPAGILLSNHLLTKLAKKLQKQVKFKESEFSIDASYEFSSYLTGIGFSLNHSDRFCIQNDNGCITFITTSSTKGTHINLNEVFFAVKTCEKFHDSRLSVVKDTWATAVKHIAYFSDTKDDKIPTIRLDVINTDHGHCGKTRGILSALRKTFKNNLNLKWAVISDDDTILGVAQILKLVSQYNSSEDIAIGERYGYNLQQDGGYNYLTGGGGVVLSRAAIMKFKKKVCICPSPSTPDDMFLFGVCLKRIDVLISHTPLIHQARPNDYNKQYLSIGTPISFHKHWMLDPRQVYKQWFETEDSLLKNVHQEL